VKLGRTPARPLLAGVASRTWCHLAANLGGYLQKVLEPHLAGLFPTTVTGLEVSNFEQTIAVQTIAVHMCGFGIHRGLRFSDLNQCHQALLGLVAICLAIHGERAQPSLRGPHRRSR
jgi:hypothetical protein